MRFTRGQLAIVGAGAVVIVGLLLALFLLPTPPAPVPEPVAETPTEEPAPAVTETIIGNSVLGRPIVAHTFGSGENHLLFVGGVHGGYEWNSSLLAYEMIDYFKANPELIVDTTKVTIIPDLNPDGTFLATNKVGRFVRDDVTNPSTRLAAGRFNQNDVDLNRNFDCKWAPESTWRGAVVSAGNGPFSEPESAALRDFVVAQKPDAAIFWHSQANNVYGSECEDGILPATLTLMSTYAAAADYGEVPIFDAYPITGDAEGWLASLGIPAVTIELETFSDIEWARNLAGVQAVLDLY